MKLSVGISPCPNDTFMFDAWIHKRIPGTETIHADFSFLDIQTLNQMALRSELDVTKLSVFTAGLVANQYEILNYGAALGYKNGPLIISKRKIYPDEIPFLKIGIPGINTTAYLLLKLFYNPQQTCKEYLFNDIEDALLDNEIDAGLIIHETRFTFQKKGLQKIVDLGEQWEMKYKLPLPLGVIAIKRSIPTYIKNQLSLLIKNSVHFAFDNPEASVNFIKQHAQETANDVIRQHINLYVNEFSKNLGDAGKKAVKQLLDEGAKLNLLPLTLSDLFFNNEE
jgi:1,4-dihydroxy-6-naphthoate synthase